MFGVRTTIYTFNISLLFKVGQLLITQSSQNSTSSLRFPSFLLLFLSLGLTFPGKEEDVERLIFLVITCENDYEKGLFIIPCRMALLATVGEKCHLTKGSLLIHEKLKISSTIKIRRKRVNSFYAILFGLLKVHLIFFTAPFLNNSQSFHPLHFFISLSFHSTKFELRDYWSYKEYSHKMIFYKGHLFFDNLRLTT